MKTVKIKFSGFWPGFDPEKLFLIKLMRKYYHVEITEDADYVICSGFGFYEYLGSEQVRIFFGGENYIPDFNFVDYAFSVYPIRFLDRHCTFPGSLLGSLDTLEELDKKSRNYDRCILDDKPFFANMIASHESEGNMRRELFELLSTYRRVEAAGSYLNNMPDGKTVNLDDGSKVRLQRQCKFTLCGESLCHEGFVTEKIFDAFCADTIPIYFGSSTVSDIFNKKAYIDVRQFEDPHDLLNKIIELDTDDEKYIAMLRQPIFKDEEYPKRVMKQLEEYIQYIFDQPVHQAYRRCALYMPKVYENCIVGSKEHKSIVGNLAGGIRMKYESLLKKLLD